MIKKFCLVLVAMALMTLAPYPQVAMSADDNLARDLCSHAAEWSHGQIEMSKLAEKSSSVGVKRYGTAQVQGFTTLLDETKAIAKEYKYTIPSEMGSKQKDTYEHLQKWNGPEFDARYMKDQIDEQKAFMDMFEKGAKDAGNKDIRDYCSKWFKECNTRHADAVTLYDKVKDVK